MGSAKGARKVQKSGKAGEEKKTVQLTVASRKLHAPAAHIVTPPAQHNSDDYREADGEESLVLAYRNKARKLALSMLRRWHARLPLDELYSVVDLTLCEAGRLYNPKKGASFITFMFYHLRGNLIRAITAAATANVAPVAQGEGQEESAEGEESHGATAMDIAESLRSSDFATPDDVLYRKEIIRLTREACAELEDVEREIVERLFIGEEQVVDIARSMGYSRCHVSRIKKDALDTLQRKLAGVVAAAARGGNERTTVQGAVARRKTLRRVVRRLPRVQTRVAANVEDMPIAAQG